MSKDKDSVNVAFNATYDYDAFGNLTENTGSEATNNPFRYNGQYTDDETGLLYLRNRYYDPTIGRFTQEDPAKDGLNWYVYCANDPVNFVDPLGLLSIGTFCKNDVSQLTEQQRKNMNSAINAYEDGFLSYGNMLENLASYGGEIIETRKLPSVVANMDGNTLNIDVYVNIASITFMDGVKVSNNFDEVIFFNNKSFQQYVCEAIESWSGSVEGININVNAIFGKSNSHKTVSVDLREGTKNGGSAPESNCIVTFSNDYTKRSTDETFRTIAHEAGGHSAFRIHDAYHDLENVSSIMCYRDYAVTNLDRAILLEAYKSGFKGTSYTDHLDKVSKYSPGWRYKK